MKKLVVVLLGLLLITGCSNAGVPLDKNDPVLSDSMKNYFSEDLSSEIVGRHFRAKIVSVVKLDFGDRAGYSYQILLAPVNDENIKLKSVTISCNKLLEKFYDKQPSINGSQTPWLGTEFDSFDMSYGPMYENKEDLPAFMAGAVGLDYYEQQKEFNYSDAEFDELMKTVRLTVKWNLFDRETLVLTYDGEIETANGNYELLKNREDLQADLYGEGSISHLRYYDGEAYPANIVKADSPTIRARQEMVKLFAEREDRNELCFSKRKAFYPPHVKDGLNQYVSVATDCGYPIYDSEGCVGLLIVHNAYGDGEQSYEYVENAEFNAEVDNANKNQEPYDLREANGGYYASFRDGHNVWLTGRKIESFNEQSYSSEEVADNERVLIFWPE